MVLAIQSPAAADPVRTPGLGEVFSGFTLDAIESGGPAHPEVAVRALIPNGAFYSEPELTGTEKPGTLLKHEPAEVLFAGFQPGSIDAHKVMYVTRGVDDKPAISTGILMIPVDGNANAERPIIGYQQANDSVGGYCHPSTMWTGGNPLDFAAWAALGPLALMFNEGFAVMISDVGNNGDLSPHGVFAAKFGGQTNLDGLRAALALDEAGLSASAPIGLFGIFAGGVGAAKAAEIQADYAPELNIKSVVLEGMVSNQQNFMRYADGSIGSGFAFANLLGLEPWFPDMNIDEKLTPLGKQVADFYRTQCQMPAYFAAPFLPLDLLFVDGQAPAEIEDFQRAFEENALGTQTPQAPVLITSCDTDESLMALAPAQDSRDLVDRYRAGGADVTYAPSDCSMLTSITDPYASLAEMFGMQTIDWLAATLR